MRELTSVDSARAPSNQGRGGHGGVSGAASRRLELERGGSRAAAAAPPHTHPPTQVMGFGDFESRIQDWGPSFQFRDFSGNIWRKLGPPDMRFFSSSSFSRHTFGLGFCHRYFQVAAALAWWCKAGFQTRSKSMCNFYMVEDASNFEYSLHAKSYIVLAFVL